MMDEAGQVFYFILLLIRLLDYIVDEACTVVVHWLAALVHNFNRLHSGYGCITEALDWLVVQIYKIAYYLR
jgi:hypothetical protein